MPDPEGSPDSSASAQRIYLDNAATSWPKPPGVVEAIEQFYRRIGGSVGRTNDAEALQAAREIQRTRQQIRQLINAATADSIVFGFNGTDVLNMGLFGLIGPGDHVVTTITEHNSVLRPLQWLQRTQDVRVDHVPCDSHGQVDPDQVVDLIRPETRAVVINHVSNVTGAVQNVQPIGRRCEELGVALVVDAAQSLGHVPVDVGQMKCALLAAPGHKGLLGPLGTGILFVRSDWTSRIRPWRLGGTGSVSQSLEMPEQWPDRMEAGNLNTPAIMGLGQAIDFVRVRTVESIQAHESRLADRLVNGLQAISGVKIFRPAGATATGVVSFSLPSLSPADVAAVLESAKNVVVRAGLHCAPLIHRSLGTFEAGGTVRVSPGVYSTDDQIDAVIDMVEQMVKED